MLKKLYNLFFLNFHKTFFSFQGEIGNVQAHFPCELITEINNIAQTKILRVALYDYNPPVQSPNHDSTLELSFLTGDVLHICE